MNVLPTSSRPQMADSKLTHKRQPCSSRVYIVYSRVPRTLYRRKYPVDAAPLSSPSLNPGTSPSPKCFLSSSSLFSPLTCSVLLFSHAGTLVMIFSCEKNGTYAHNAANNEALMQRFRRNMNPAEQAEYIRAVKCLQAQPIVKPAYPAARTRFDEFQAHYMKQADNVHNLVRQLASCSLKYLQTN